MHIGLHNYSQSVTTAIGDYFSLPCATRRRVQGMQRWFAHTRAALPTFCVCVLFLSALIG